MNVLFVRASVFEKVFVNAWKAITSEVQLMALNSAAVF